MKTRPTSRRPALIALLAVAVMAAAGCDDDERKSSGPDGTYSAVECQGLRLTAYYDDTASDSDAAKAEIEYEVHC